MGRISTTIGTEGFDLVDGRSALIADSAPAFADAVVRLYDDRDLWETLSVEGLAAVRRFTPEAIEPRLCELLEGLIRPAVAGEAFVAADRER